LATIVLEKIARDFYDGRQMRRVLYPTDLDLKPGELTIVSGPSGSGKTTLISIMGLVLKPSEGRLFLEGKEVTRLSDEKAAGIRLEKYGFVFQQAMLIEGLTVMQNVLLSYAIQGGRVSAEQRRKAMEILRALGWRRRPACSRSFYPVA
jgi:putative ABC transport system ATP-binding protein